MAINKVGILGVGAVGSMLVDCLFAKHPDDLCVLATGSRSNRLAFDGLTVNGKTIHPKVRDVSAGINDIDLIIIAVKNYHLDSVVNDLEGRIAPGTFVLPVLNGVAATPTLAKAFPSARVLHGIVMRTDAERRGHRVTYNTAGELQFGYAKNSPVADEIIEIKNWLSVDGLKPVVYPDMERMQWKKWLVNIGANQVSVLARAEFRFFGRVSEIVELMRLSMDEILNIAKRKHVDLTEEDRDEVIQILINYPPHKKTSMLQDIEACRRTEIDAFAGTVVEYGRELGIETPYNNALYLGIKAMEKVYLSE